MAFLQYSIVYMSKFIPCWFLRTALSENLRKRTEISWGTYIPFPLLHRTFLWIFFQCSSICSSLMQSEVFYQTQFALGFPFQAMWSGWVCYSGALRHRIWGMMIFNFMGSGFEVMGLKCGCRGFESHCSPFCTGRLGHRVLWPVCEHESTWHHTWQPCP